MDGNPPLRLWYAGVQPTSESDDFNQSTLHSVFPLSTPWISTPFLPQRFTSEFVFPCARKHYNSSTPVPGCVWTSSRQRVTITAHSNKHGLFAHACVPPSRTSRIRSVFPQLRKERSLGEETAHRLSAKETAVRELTKRLRDAEKAAAAATAAAEAAVVGTRLSTGVRLVCPARGHGTVVGWSFVVEACVVFCGVENDNVMSTAS